MDGSVSTLRPIFAAAPRQSGAARRNHRRRHRHRRHAAHVPVPKSPTWRAALHVACGVVVFELITISVIRFKSKKTGLWSTISHRRRRHRLRHRPVARPDRRG
jgi:hypothetical protein